MNSTPEEEQFDDDNVEDLWEKIREEGRRVARHEWDSGGPGAGAGVVSVHLYNDTVYAENDVECYGPFETFDQAAAAVSLFHKTDATTEIWVDPQFR
jgi:hypothetical protein